MCSMTNPDRRIYQFPHPTVVVGDRTFGLGRHVNHDPRSRRYPFRAAPVEAEEDLVPVFHERHIPIFDQGNLGSCTGNAALGILATGPYWDVMSDSVQQYGPQTPTGRLAWTEHGAVDLYSLLTAADDYPGQYPPDDTGSDGLTAGKVLTADGIVPGYQHTFSASDAVRALQEFPLLVGTAWTEQMFYPDSLGRIDVQGSTAGGHEWIVDEFVPIGQVPVGGSDVLSFRDSYLGGTTSWGTSFGVAGRFYLSFSDFNRLLESDGDVIVLTPPNAPAPQPEPVPTPTPPPAPDPGPAPGPAPTPTHEDVRLAHAMRRWLDKNGL